MELDNPPVGVFNLKFALEGYKEKQVEIHVRDGQTNDLGTATLELDPEDSDNGNEESDLQATTSR